MLYSSGTTGRPKGILRPLPELPAEQQLPLFDFLIKIWQYREGMIYLSPAPLYHSAPQAAVNLTISMGGTAIIMERFDPEQYLEAIPKWGVTHTQLVPTMFSRMLKLPDEVRKRYDLSSLEIAIHAAAPCPALVKDDIIKWWGPIIHEYYGATEGLGFTACNSQEWLAHRGTVGRVLLGDLHILDENMKPCPMGTAGTVWFKTATPFEYFNDPGKTQEARSADGSMSTVGDVGYVDDDGYLYLTDRATFMIISGGVNIYPQECENLLITHPKIADAAVFGVPNPDLGEEVKAVVQPMPGVSPAQELADELIAFCSQSLSRQKVPRSIDFEAELPRLPTGKIYKGCCATAIGAIRTHGSCNADTRWCGAPSARRSVTAKSCRQVPRHGLSLVRIVNPCSGLAGCLQPRHGIVRRNRRIETENCGGDHAERSYACRRDIVIAAGLPACVGGRAEAGRHSQGVSPRQPGSASIHEGATYSINIPFMPVFNNLVMFNQGMPQNSVEIDRA